MAQNRTKNILDQLLQSRERARERAAANPAFPFQEDLRNLEADLQSQQALEGMEANQAQRLELAQAPATIGGAEAPGETVDQVLEREFDYTGQAAAYDRDFDPRSAEFAEAEANVLRPRRELAEVQSLENKARLGHTVQQAAGELGETPEGRAVLTTGKHPPAAKAPDPLKALRVRVLETPENYPAETVMAAHLGFAGAAGKPPGPVEVWRGKVLETPGNYSPEEWEAAVSMEIKDKDAGKNWGDEEKRLKAENERAKWILDDFKDMKKDFFTNYLGRGMLHKRGKLGLNLGRGFDADSALAYWDRANEEIAGNLIEEYGGMENVPKKLAAYFSKRLEGIKQQLGRMKTKGEITKEDISLLKTLTEGIGSLVR